MKKIKIAIQNNDLNKFKEECEKNYLDDKTIISILRQTVKEKKLDFFNFSMRKLLNPEVFLTINNDLLKNNQYDFIKLMIQISRDFEMEENKKNEYVNQLLFDFIEKDDLYFVSYLVNYEKASTDSIQEIGLTILSECARHNSIKCFDYFVSRGKNIHEYGDSALFCALENKSHEIINLILNIDKNMDEELERNFFKYGELSKKELLKLQKIVFPLCNTSEILKNAFNYQLIEKNMFKQLEENLSLGHSPVGDKYHDLMLIASLKSFENYNLLKGMKLLLDFGAELKEEHLKSLTLEQKEEIETYPRFSKIKANLEKKLPKKGKTSFSKI